MNLRPNSPTSVVSPESVTSDGRTNHRFGRIFYERMMGAMPDFAMLFDNISPYAAQRVWVMYFETGYPYQLIREWRRLGREVPDSLDGRMTWYDIQRGLFMMWCESQRIAHHMVYDELPLEDIPSDVEDDI